MMMGVVNNTNVDNNKKKKGRRHQQKQQRSRSRSRGQNRSRSRSRSLHLKMIIIFLVGIISVIRLLKQHLDFIIVPLSPNNNTSSSRTTSTTEKTTSTTTKKIMKKQQLSFDNENDNENSSGNTLKRTIATTTKQQGIRSNNIPSSFNPRKSSNNNNNKRKNLQHQQKHHHIPASLKKPLFQTTTFEDSNGQQQQQQQQQKQQQQQQQQQHRKYYYEPIRNWGCSRTETPLIFVHLGKAGGGSIRARLAASAQNFTRYIDGSSSSSSSSQSQWKHQQQDGHGDGDGDAALIDDNHYYPISDTGDERAYYCSSKYKHHRMIPNSTIFKKSMEGLLPCFAKTPIGMALACPEIVTKKTKSKSKSGGQPRERKKYIIISNNNSFVSRGAINNERCRGCQNLQSECCHTVYTGHNALGSELHWLPPKYLQNWWDSISTSSSNGVLSLSYDRQPSSSSSSSSLSLQIQEGLQRLEPYDQRWCIQYQQSRPLLIIKNADSNNNNMDPDDNDSGDNNVYSQCSTILSSKYDSLFEQYWQIQQQQQQQQEEETSAETKPTTTETTTTTMDYSSLYASMPLHRITMLREPFSWLLSKFYWHKTHKMGYKCDDDVQKSIGWIQLYCLDYLIKICGDDCANRLDYALQNQSNINDNSHDASSEESSSLLLLEELEQQAANNLRRSFSVVGILNETESFYDMVTRRIKYIDMSLNPQIVGDIHPSIQHPTEETERCQKLFLQDEKFQNILKNSIPIVATIDRLYQFGMKVNRHQMIELATCSSN